MVSRSSAWPAGIAQIELDVRQFAQPTHVLILNVTAILTQMHGDAISPTQMRLDRSPDRIGFMGTARLSHRGDMIDVDPQFDQAMGCNDSGADVVGHVEQCFRVIGSGLQVL